MENLNKLFSIKQATKTIKAGIKVFLIELFTFSIFTENQVLEADYWFPTCKSHMVKQALS